MAADMWKLDTVAWGTFRTKTADLPPLSLRRLRYSTCAGRVAKCAVDLRSRHQAQICGHHGSYLDATVPRPSFIVRVRHVDMGDACVRYFTFWVFQEHLRGTCSIGAFASIPARPHRHMITLLRIRALTFSIKKQPPATRNGWQVAVGWPRGRVVR